MNGRKLNRTAAEEAAAWVARLKDAHSISDRRAFEQWLVQDPAHGPAYDHALDSFEASGVLRTSELGRTRNLASAFPSRAQKMWRGLAIASTAALLFICSIEFVRGPDPLRPVALETVLLSSGDEARNITLADGSKLGMAPATEIRIVLNRSERIAEIRKGDVRLIVARDRRPFRIVAAGQTEEADTGMFDARVVAGRGSILARRSATGGTAAADAQQGGSGMGTSSTSEVIELKAVPLGQAIQTINRMHAGPRIEIEPALANLRVTGIFQQGSSETIAHSLALAFHLRLVRTSPQTILLSDQK